jgi:molybdopterin/thiamine biosynthesis adenylyltransferase
VAAKFIMSRIKGVKIQYFNKSVQELQVEDASFFSKYQVIIGGLDNVQTRLFLNSVVHTACAAGVK